MTHSEENKHEPQEKNGVQNVYVSDFVYKEVPAAGLSKLNNRKLYIRDIFTYLI